MDWQKYPKSRKSIRINQPQTLESKECPTLPEIWDGLCEAFCRIWAASSSVPKVLKMRNRPTQMQWKSQADAAENQGSLTQNSHGTAARATSTDGNNYSSSGWPGVTHVSKRLSCVQVCWSLTQNCPTWALGWRDPRRTSDTSLQVTRPSNRAHEL